MNFQADIWSRTVKAVTVLAAVFTIGLSCGVYLFHRPWGMLRNAALAMALIGLAHGMWENYCESGRKKDLKLAGVFLVSAAVCILCSASLY